jgi:hypothetical protein
VPTIAVGDDFAMNPIFLGDKFQGGLCSTVKVVEGASKLVELTITN